MKALFLRDTGETEWKELEAAPAVIEEIAYAPLTVVAPTESHKPVPTETKRFDLKGRLPEGALVYCAQGWDIRVLSASVRVHESSPEIEADLHRAVMYEANAYRARYGPSSLVILSAGLSEKEDGPDQPSDLRQIVTARLLVGVREESRVKMGPRLVSSATS